MRRQRVHLCDHTSRVDIGRAKQLERARGAAAFRQIRAFHHHRAA